MGASQSGVVRYFNLVIYSSCAHVVCTCRVAQHESSMYIRTSILKEPDDDLSKEKPRKCGSHDVSQDRKTPDHTKTTNGTTRWFQNSPDTLCKMNLAKLTIVGQMTNFSPTRGP